MRFHAEGALFFLLLYLAAVRPGLAQKLEQGQEEEKPASAKWADRVTRNAPGPQQKLAVSRLLTPNEGLAILGAALDSRHHQSDFSSDCSHFVHGLYERAGFHYEYAGSSDLYEGTDQFRQVASPQPGDLAVWRGHAGIVVNPEQHSFFSVLHSGPGVDSYDSAYWKQRGRPRFFRYRMPVLSGVLKTSIRIASWQPTVLNDEEPYEAAPGGRVPGISAKYSSHTASAAKLVANKPVDSEIPRVVVLTSVRPKSDQVSAAFLRACNDSEEMLRGSDLFKSAESLVVFDHFEVKKVHITANQGWIEIQIDDLFSLTGGKAEVHKRWERQRWALRRDDNSWKLTPSANAIYLPRHAAERLLAHEFTQLAEDTSDNTRPEKAQLARVLDVLFVK
jgi:NlpC/P60 family